MKLYKLLFFLLPSTLLMSCNMQSNSDYKYSEKATEQFLNEITKNAIVSITDITEINNQPTDKFEVITKHTLSEEEIEEYNKNNGTIINKNDNIYDFANYKLKEYQLSNEKNEVMEFVDNGRSNNLQEFPLAEYNNVRYRKLGISFTLNKKFEKLNGFITIEFEMPNGMEKEIKIPVAITTNDKILE